MRGARRGPASAQQRDGHAPVGGRGAPSGSDGRVRAHQRRRRQCGLGGAEVEVCAARAARQTVQTRRRPGRTTHTRRHEHSNHKSYR